MAENETNKAENVISNEELQRSLGLLSEILVFYSYIFLGMIISYRR